MGSRETLSGYTFIDSPLADGILQCWNSEGDSKGALGVHRPAGQAELDAGQGGQVSGMPSRGHLSLCASGPLPSICTGLIASFGVEPLDWHLGERGNPLTYFEPSARLPGCRAVGKVAWVLNTQPQSKSMREPSGAIIPGAPGAWNYALYHLNQMLPLSVAYGLCIS